jgi:hypothetical protein
LEAILTKRIFVLCVLLSAVYYGFSWLIPEQEDIPRPAAQPSQTIEARTIDTPTAFCEVMTEVDKGHVNLRTCAGTACPVLLVLEDGQALTVIQSGTWNEVKTFDGVRGWINSNFCK